ncbi:hypothetical protein TWF281_009645 [Arthrobotrys megalospora]
MATLDLLPVDLKFLILSSLTTIRSLRSLRKASLKYQAVFVEYQSLVESSVYCNEALDLYSRESLWLARYHNRLHTIDIVGSSKADIALQTALEYIAYPQLPPPPTGFQFNSTMGPRERRELEARFDSYASGFKTNQRCRSYKLRKEDQERMAKHHKVIVGIFERFVKRELLIIAPEISTSDERGKVERAVESHCLVSTGEEERIIEGIYRFFVGLNIAKYLPHSRGWNDSYQGAISSIPKLWGFWGTVAVQATREFLLDLIEMAGANHPAQKIRYHNGSEYSYYEEPGISVPNLILFSGFPDNILHWIDGVYAEDPQAKVEELQKAPDSDALFTTPWDTNFALFLSFRPWQYSYWGEVDEAYLLRDGVSPRLQKPGTSGKRPEIRAGLWDNWRLEKYGYGYCSWSAFNDTGSDRRFYRYFPYITSDNPEWDESYETESEGEEELVPEKFPRYKHQGKWRSAKGEGMNDKGGKGQAINVKAVKGGSSSNLEQRQVKQVKPEVERVEKYLQELEDLRV